MYHNATHVCDVVHAAWWVLEQGGLAEMMQPRAVFAALCAAAAHDTGHPGLNNVFWAASGSELALSYHGRSVLENYHIYQAFALMRDPEANIFDGMSDEDAKFVREAMIDAIIATDLAYHDDHNRAAFQQKVQAGGAASFSLDNDDDQRMLVLMCLKLSDLANPCKGWDVYVRWIDCLFQEFYAQGEVEARQGLTTAPHMDRNGPTCPSATTPLSLVLRVGILGARLTTEHACGQGEGAARVHHVPPAAAAGGVAAGAASAATAPRRPGAEPVAPGAVGDGADGAAARHATAMNRLGSFSQICAVQQAKLLRPRQHLRRLVVAERRDGQTWHAALDPKLLAKHELLGRGLPVLRAATVCVRRVTGAGAERLSPSAPRT